MAPQDETLSQLKDRLQNCRLCAGRFAQTATAHEPRPVLWFQPGTPIVVAGQAPGKRVHDAGKPFFDPSGDRLRDWMGIDQSVFYDQDKLSVLPMAFCFPGYNEKGADLPPPPLCKNTWHIDIMAHLGPPPLLLLVGGYAQKWHLGKAAKGNVTETVRSFHAYAPHVFPLPHPSWRNTAWLKKNPWFEADLLPKLRQRVQEVLHD